MQDTSITRNSVNVVLCVLFFLVLIQGVQGEETCAFIRMWGSDGGGSSTTAKGIAADAYDNVYVTDTGNNRVLKYGFDRSIVTYWDLRDTETGQSGIPYGIAVDASHNVYVTDRENNTVHKLTYRGNQVWGSEGTGNGQFSHPTGIAVDSSGNVYVADTGNNRIQKFHSTGMYLMQWGSYGTTDGVFNAPEGVTVDASGHVYVADTGNKRIQKFSPAGTFLAKWGSEGTGNGQFSHPAGIAVDSSGNIYVADLTSRVQKFNPVGELISTCETGGNTCDVAVDPSGTMYALWQSDPLWKIGMYGTATSTPTKTPAPLCTSIVCTGQVTAVPTKIQVTPTPRLTTAPTTRVTGAAPSVTPAMDSDVKSGELEEQPAEQGRKREEQGNILDQITAFLGKLLGRK